MARKLINLIKQPKWVPIDSDQYKKSPYNKVVDH